MQQVKVCLFSPYPPSLPWLSLLPWKLTLPLSGNSLLQSPLSHVVTTPSSAPSFVIFVLPAWKRKSCLTQHHPWVAPLHKRNWKAVSFSLPSLISSHLLRFLIMCVCVCVCVCTHTYENIIKNEKLNIPYYPIWRWPLLILNCTCRSFYMDTYISRWFFVLLFAQMRSYCVCMLSNFSQVWLFVNPRIVACQASLPMEISKQEH